VNESEKGKMITFITAVGFIVVALSSAALGYLLIAAIDDATRRKK
jgi:hypothetical protein